MYPYGLNERAKSFNLEQPTGKLFPPLPRFANRCENLEKRFVNKTNQIRRNLYLSSSHSKILSDSFYTILEGMKRKDLIKLASNATDALKTC